MKAKNFYSGLNKSVLGEASNLAQKNAVRLSPRAMGAPLLV
jgi:hypothetical protein